MRQVRPELERYADGPRADSLRFEFDRVFLSARDGNPARIAIEVMRHMGYRHKDVRSVCRSRRADKWRNRVGSVGDFGSYFGIPSYTRIGKRKGPELAPMSHPNPTPKQPPTTKSISNSYFYLVRKSPPTNSKLVGFAGGSRDFHSYSWFGSLMRPVVTKVKAWFVWQTPQVFG